MRRFMHEVNMHVKNGNSPCGLALSYNPLHNVCMSIETLRQSKGLNQTDLSEMTGISQSTLSRAENLDDGTTLRTLRSIAKVLGVGLKDLFDDRPETEQRLLEVFRQLPADRQELWLEMSRTFAQGQTPPKS